MPTAAAMHGVGAIPPAKAGSTPAPAAAPVLEVKRVEEHAVLPKRGSAGAAGYDLASSEDAVVPARGKAMVSTGISIAIPQGTYAR